MPEKNATLLLLVKEPGKDEQRKPFTQESVTIGAGEKADLQVGAGDVSDPHAMIDLSSEDGVLVLDLGSNSGTFVNGNKLEEQAQVKAGDVVKVGDVEIVVEAIGEEAEALLKSEGEAVEKEEKAGDKGLEKKMSAFERKKKKRKSAPAFDFDPAPRKNEVPKAKKPLLEVRKIYYGDTIDSIKHLSSVHKFTLGEKKSCDEFMSVDSLPSDGFAIVEGVNGGWGFNFSGEMKGYLFQSDGTETSFEELIKEGKTTQKGNIHQLKLEPGQAVLYDFGAVSFYLRLTEPVKLVTAPFYKEIDVTITVLVAFFIAFHAFGTWYIKQIPPPEVADILDAPERFAKLVLEPVEMEEPPPEEEEKKKVMKESEAKAIGEEGKIGKEESKIDKAQGDARKRLEDEKVANSSGILGALDQGMEQMDKIFGGGGLGAGLDKNLGMLDGISGLDMRGAGGLGSRGAGYGGGGMALGIGGLGTRGRGGSGGRSNYGLGASKSLKKKRANINIKQGNPTIAGSLDKSIIARIIRKHYSQIRYCYQKELNKNPKLYGKITVKFTISATGRVASSVVQVSTMKNYAVESCVAKTIKRIIFPRPKGGGIVVVTYPFIFKSEGN